MRISSLAILAMLMAIVALGASVSPQQRVIERMAPFDYDVAPNWSLPYPKTGYTWGSVPGVFVESDDRIFIVSRGEIPIPNPAPATFQGFFGSLRSALGAPENEIRNCIRVVDSTGKVLEM